MQINFDKLALIAIAMALTLQWTPAFGLLSWQYWSGILLAIFLIILLCYWFFRHVGIIFFYVFFAFVCLSYFQQHALRDYLVANSMVSQKITAEIRIDEILQQQTYQTLIASTENAQRIYVQWRLDEKPKIGEYWRASLQLKPISSRLNQGGFDRQQWYFAKGITAIATVKSAVKTREDFLWREKRFHQAFEQTKTLTQQGLLLALGFGERAWLAPETWAAYQQTNTAHLIAISGLHIGLAMLLGLWLSRVLQFFFPTHWITPLFPLVIGMTLAVIYAELAGFAVPTFRAVIALLLLLMMKLWRGYHTPWQLFLRVVALLLFCDPIMVLSASFWLSIGAVASLILWYQVFPLKLIQWRGQPLPPRIRPILGLFHLQFGLFWLFTPIQLSMFGGFSLNGFVANLIAVPFYSFLLVPLTLFATLTNGAAYSWQMANLGADKITAIVQLFQGEWLIISEHQILIFTAFLALSFVFFMNKVYGRNTQKVKYDYIHLDPARSLSEVLRKRISVLGIFLSLSCIGNVIWQTLNEPQWRVETLDVGQGLATLIVKNDHGVLYDTGASWTNGSMAKTEILPYLQRQGIDLDGLILSHDDNDHSGGALDILWAYPKVNLFTPSRRNDEKVDRTFCTAGRIWQWQNLTFSVLSPTHIVERAENAHSCVVLVSDGQFNVLLMGDADIATELKLLPYLSQIDVLQVGHHGSKTSTGSRFVQHIQPKIALISSGRWNPWHFPNKAVVSKLESVGSVVKNTAISGQISVAFHQTGISLQEARSDFSPWYRGFIGEN